MTGLNIPQIRMSNTTPFTIVKDKIPAQKEPDTLNIYEYFKPLNDGSADVNFYFNILIFIILILSLVLLYIFIINLKKFFKVKRKLNVNNKHLIQKPILSAALSILFPGFGQIYIRETLRGIIYIFLSLSTCLILFFTLAIAEDLVPTDDKSRIVYFFVSTPFVIFLIFVYINSVIDAYRTALAINRKMLHLVRQNENYLKGWMKLGRALYNKQYYQDAVELYTTIISLYPTYALAHYNRAVVYYKIHNYAKAGIDFIAAEKLGHEKAKRILKADKNAIT